MTLSKNAEIVMANRISPRDKDGTPLETPDETFMRVATAIADAEKDYGADDETVGKFRSTFFNMMSNVEFIPNSPALVNAGRELGQLSACFVIPVPDSLSGIMDAVKLAAMIHKTGGGTGFSFSRLRPEGENVSMTSGIASGPVSFMGIFDKATSVIKQGGTRRGANMGILAVDHPDILKFIHCKDDLASITNFNISVAITDKFMEDLKNGDEHANSIWQQIAESAHKTGDPGLFFVDRVNAGKGNPVPVIGPVESTNPCGEQPLYPYDSCNLGSINLVKFINEDATGVDSAFDWGRLGECVSNSVRFLDNVITINKFPSPEIEYMTKNIRRIGLGIMGFADSLMRMSVPYDSETAILIAEKTMQFIQEKADETSRLLAVTRGPFPLWEESIYKDAPVRNATRTTIAPTGTISIIANCSSGIEPVFSLVFKRSHYLDPTDPDKRVEMLEINPSLYITLAHQLVPLGEEGIRIRDAIVHDLLEGISREEVQNKYNVKLPDYLKTAMEIAPEAHVRMQAAFQKFTDNSVSKTINMPEAATVEDIKKAYQLAWDEGCNGITVYRDNSRSNQVLKFERKADNGSSGTSELVGDEVQHNESTRRRPSTTRGAVNHSFRIGDFKSYFNVGLYEDGSPCELFIVANKSGSTTRGYMDVIGKLVSVGLQHGIDLSEYADSFIGTKFEPSGLSDNSELRFVSSPLDYIGRWLREAFGEYEGESTDMEIVEKQGQVFTGDLCPDCEGKLYYAEGCMQCIACGYSRCG